MCTISAARETGSQVFSTSDTARVPGPGKADLADTTEMRQPPEKAFTDSLAGRQDSGRFERLNATFTMHPRRTEGPPILRQRWAQVGIMALTSGLLAYFLRREADNAYSKYLSADRPETMNHYFNRAVLYDKVSSGLFIFCEINFSFSMWLSVRRVAND